jgi:alpha-ketoglutarate-dependent taurine dioxygenase
LFTPTDRGIDIELNGRRARLSWRWLRDHGEDEASCDPDTLQRRVDTFAIDPGLTGVVHLDGEGATVTWNDGATTFHSRQLLQSVMAEFTATAWDALPEFKPRLAENLVLWSDPTSAPADVDLDGFLTDDSVLALGVSELWRYGYLVLRGGAVRPGVDGRYDKSRAAEFAQRLGYVRHTIFGAMWDLAPDLTDHADTAYTSMYLGPHTDGTYSHDAPGLQFFLALQPAASGGESLLVDGFAIAAELADSDPAVFVDLASIPVPGRYVEPGVDLRAERPVFRSNARGVLDQVSFNNYDRAPFLLPPDLERRFYLAYGRFAELATDPARRAAITLTSGDILVFDNWRTLHGRNAFRGYRHYFGAYLNHEDLESKRRVLLETPPHRPSGPIR